MNINLSDLLDLVLQEGQVSITVSQENVLSIRRGISQRKYYLNKDLLERGLLPDNSRLSFSERPLEDNKILLTIKSREPRTVDIISIHKPMQEDILL